MAHDDVCLRLANTHESEPFIEPNGWVHSKHLEANCLAISDGGVENLANEARSDATVLMFGQNKDAIEFDVISVFRDEQTADRLTVQLYDFMRGGIRSFREVLALPTLIPRAVRGFNVWTEGPLQKIVEELSIRLRPLPACDAERHDSPPSSLLCRPIASQRFPTSCSKPVVDSTHLRFGMLEPSFRPMLVARYLRRRRMPAAPSSVANNAMATGVRNGTGGAGTGLATRKPTELLSNAGAPKNWTDAARLTGLLLKFPPRRTRRVTIMTASFHSNTFPTWSKVRSHSSRSRVLPCWWAWACSGLEQRGDGPNNGAESR